jgi:hypothetical protein
MPDARCAKTPAGREHVRRMKADTDVHKDIPVKPKPASK